MDRQSPSPRLSAPDIESPRRGYARYVDDCRGDAAADDLHVSGAARHSDREAAPGIPPLETTKDPKRSLTTNPDPRRVSIRDHLARKRLGRDRHRGGKHPSNRDETCRANQTEEEFHDTTCWERGMCPGTFSSLTFQRRTRRCKTAPWVNEKGVGHEAEVPRARSQRSLLERGLRADRIRPGLSQGRCSGPAESLSRPGTSNRGGDRGSLPAGRDGWECARQFRDLPRDARERVRQFRDLPSDTRASPCHRRDCLFVA